MTNDRLQELQVRAGIVPASEATLSGTVPGSEGTSAGTRSEATLSRRAGPLLRLLSPLRLSRDPSGSAEQQLLHALSQVDGALQECHQSADQISSQHRQQLNSPAASTAGQPWQRTQQLSSDLLRQLAATKIQLDQIQTKVNSSDTRLTATQRAVVQTQVNSKRRQLLEAVQKFNNEQLAFKERKKDHLKRQLRITGATVTDAELEGLIEQDSSQIFNDGIVLRTEAARDSLDAVENRFKQLQQVEVSIQQLHEMFLQLSLLVQQQGDTIDSIEAHVQQTAGSTQHGRDELQQALHKQQVSRKTKLGCAIFGVIAAVVLVIVLIVSLS